MQGYKLYLLARQNFTRNLPCIPTPDLPFIEINAAWRYKPLTEADICFPISRLNNLRVSELAVWQMTFLYKWLNLPSLKIWPDCSSILRCLSPWFLAWGGQAGWQEYPLLSNNTLLILQESVWITVVSSKNHTLCIHGIVPAKYKVCL